MILAAGRGERLRPITDSTPKPLIQVGQNTLIEHHLTKLSNIGFKHVVINVSYLAEIIIKYLGSGNRFGLKISYSREPDNALETGGGIVKALDLLEEEQFLVANSDIFTDYEFSKPDILESAKAHLVLVSNPQHNFGGDFCLVDGRVQQPSNLYMTETTYTFSGIGYYRRSLFESYSPNKLSLAQILEQPVKNGIVSGEIHKSLWIDVGNPERLAQARKKSLRNTQ